MLDDDQHRCTAKALWAHASVFEVALRSDGKPEGGYSTLSQRLSSVQLLDCPLAADIGRGMRALKTHPIDRKLLRDSHEHSGLLIAYVHSS